MDNITVRTNDNGTVPEISVVIPTFRRPRFLSQAIQSVLSQTYPSLEVIVVEDGVAGDASPVVRSFDDPRLRYVWQHHAGRSAARNRGMQVAQGRYIAFLDDDDLYLPSKLASQVAFLEVHPELELVGSGARIVNEEGEVLGRWRPWLDVPDLTLLRCLYSCPLAPSMVLLRRRALARLAVWFDPEMHLAEDTDFFVRLLQAGCHMAWLPELLSAYRVHAGGSQGDGPGYSRATLRILDKLYEAPNTPLEIATQRTHLYAHYHLVGACFSYATGHVSAAWSELEEALALEPQMAEGELPPVAMAVAAFANSIRVRDPKVYVDFVFDHLPPSLVHLIRFRGEAHSALHMERVFMAQRIGERIPTREWLEGVWHAPRWLRNRGVWSIAADILLGQRTSSRLRHAYLALRRKG